MTSLRRTSRILLSSLVVSLALSVPASAAPLSGSGGGYSARQVVRWTFGSQRRMLQVATIGMCLALWIIIKK